MKPYFISLEGIDGAGKSSHIPFIVEYLTNRGYEVVCTREPGGTPLSEKLREELLHTKMCDKTELLLMFAARAELIDKVINPALMSGKIVVSDRFHDSSFAFQGGGRGMSITQISELDNWVAGFRPNLTLYFDLPVATASDRMGDRNLDKFESEKSNFHANVRKEYLRRAFEEPNRIKVIDATGTIDEVRELVKNVLDEAYGEI